MDASLISAFDRLSRRRALGRMGVGTSALVAALGMQTFTARASVAAQLPACHWGTFTRTFCPGTSLRIAQNALTSYQLNLDVDASQGGFMVVGQNATVEVVVVAIPLSDQSTWFLVHAASSDSVTAETARNTVRQHIADSVPFDCGSNNVPAYD